VSHRINVLSNFVSKDDCQYAINIINEFNNNNMLNKFTYNTDVLVAPETDDVVSFIKSILMKLYLFIKKIMDLLQNFIQQKHLYLYGILDHFQIHTQIHMKNMNFYNFQL